MEKWEAAYLAGIIDGEGSISLTRMHSNENRRPCISVSSTDKELLLYIKEMIGNGTITNKKNYKPNIHKDSYTLSIKKKSVVFFILKEVYPFLRVTQKKKRAHWILSHYELVTPRNGKYNETLLKSKKKFEELFFSF